MTIDIIAGNGSVNPMGTNLYVYKTSVNIIATPYNGYTFGGWSGDYISNQPSITLTIDKDTTVHATFTAIMHTIVATSGAHGRISPEGGVQVVEGTDFSFTFIPDNGYHVDTVIVDGVQVNARNFYIFRNVIGDHTITVNFAENHPPVINSFSLASQAGNAPFLIHATVDAYDPDGGNIVKYVWNITGKRNEQIISSAPVLDHNLIVDGVYYLSVTVIDDEGETSSSQVYELNVSESSPVEFPLPTLFGLKGLKSDLIDVSSTIINVFNENATITFETFDSEGNFLEEKNVVIPPHGTYEVSNLEFDSDFASIKALADKYVVVVSDLKGDNFEASSYLSTKLRGKLFIPHIAEETDYWSSFGYISNYLNFNLMASIAGADYDLGNYKTVAVDFESIIPSIPEVSTNWGVITPELDNPFVNSNVLSGFEVFVKDGEDGAAVEMNCIPSKRLYIPHIPEEANQFWTGLVLVNTGNEKAQIEINYYTSDGLLAGNQRVEIEPKCKFKTLIDDILPNTDKTVSWAIIDSSENVVGIELFGTYDGAICGYALSDMAMAWGVCPEILSGNYWTGIVIANINNDNATVNLELRDKNGNIKAVKTITIEALNRFKALAEDLFEGVAIEDGDTVSFTSDKPIVGLKISGDFDGKVMKALSFTE